ncbi:MAG: SDR family oxidoreductase [Sphaerochaetaceae bacterium]
MFDVKNKKVLVTGSTQGIGKEIATAFATSNAEVWIHGSRQEKTERVAKEIGMSCRPVWADLTENDCAEKLFSVTGDIDILILNASIQYRHSWKEITTEEFDTQMHVNLLSSLKLIQKYYPSMFEKKWGRIITIGSVQQNVPHKDMAIYAASKAGLDNMVKNLAKQLAPNQVTVNNVIPGAMATPRNATVIEDKQYLTKVLKGIPLGRMGKASDCNGVCLLLASEEGAYITGSTISIDGGMSL